MKMNLRGKRILSLVLAGVMLTSTCLPAMASGAQDDLATSQTRAYETVQLDTAPTKIMDYYAAADAPAMEWVTNSGAVSFLPVAAIEEDVTCAVRASDGAVWIGTKNGLMRMDLTEKDARDIVQYFAGNRYLYNGNDHVTGLAADDNGGVWARNSDGVVHINMVEMSMEERTYFYEKLINDVNDRRGMIAGSSSYTYDPASDEYYGSPATNDNDGLWTAMYAMGEIMRYQTLKNEGADEAQIAAAKKTATRATKAVLLLDYISGRGNGFPCRSYMLKSEAGAQLDANGMQIQNGFWFEKRMLNEGETYPAPIIDELKQDKNPIGIATVRITKDAMDKRGSQIFPQDTDYNGLGLSQSSIDTFNTVRAEGNKLGTDIVSGNRNQVFPVMVKGVNVGQSYTAPTTPITEDDIVFRLTAPIYERIPQTFNELFPDSVIGEDGYVDESQIVYKADTSSDEVDGHYALFLTAYRYLCDEAEDAELKDMVAEACIRMTDLILEDDRYYIVDATGKATQWSRWLSRYFNDSLDLMKDQDAWELYRIGVDENGEDALSYGYEDGPLNALEVMAALKVAAYIAGAEGEADKAATYNVAYGQCFESPYSGGGNPNNPASYENGKGYIDMALEYVERRIIRQNTDAYDENNNTPVTEYTPGDKIFNNALHEDWTQYVNYSDEELGWFPVYCLITLEDNSDRYGKIVEAFDQWYDGQEEREENPFYTFLYQLAHPEKDDVDLASAIRFFYRSPLLRNNRMYARGDRQDVFYIEAGNRDSRAQTNYLITWDEMNIGKHNHNPFERYQGYGQQTGTPYTYGSLDCGTVFTLPYWLGRYYGIIEETEGVRFTRATPDVTVETGSALVATVTDNGTPLSRMIVDFYSDGAYIGRARTDASGKATLEKSASGAITVTVTERLIGETMYDQVSASADSAPVEPEVKPTALALSLPEGMEMVVGDSRSIDFVILPESNPYRGVSWTSSDETVATVDEWGRVTAHASGTVTITATAKAAPTVTDSGEITVVDSLADLTTIARKDIVNYEGSAAAEVDNLQKYVDRYTKDEALADDSVPESVKTALNGGTGSTAPINEGNVTWTLEEYGIKRTDIDSSHERDAEQLFMGNRYLPGDAAETPDTSIIHMESDNSNGLWVASANAVTHIRMEELSYTDKAAEMSAFTQENVARRGMVAQASRNGDSWAPTESDNDGLWTAMYGVGELMRYAVLKDDPDATEDEVATAKEAALNSIKAVLLLSNITCREGPVDAYVRPLQNDSNQYNFLPAVNGVYPRQGPALLKDRDLNLNTPQSGPTGAAAPVYGDEWLAPFFPEDWAIVTKDSDKADFATRTRTLKGFIARTYRLDDEFPGLATGGNYYWDIEGDEATCLPHTDTKKVRWEEFAGTTVDASGEIPNVLIDLLGEGNTKNNVTYRADTSTDEIIGHLFIYKVAYDILGDDGEEGEIKEVLVDTVRNFAQHMLDNGYCLRDASGQATSWGKTERDYFNNVYAWEDCALNSLVNLCTFKLAGYVTGEQRWEDEYRMLALDDPYRYADLAGEYWDRWEYLAKGELGETATAEDIYTWILQNLNYSDEEMAMEAYYLLFQMEEDKELIEKYRDGLEDWWNSMKYSENPLWYYIYQLAYPDEIKTDYYGNSLVDTASWALSRHPIDTVKWAASNDNRPDVYQDGELSRDKETNEIRVVPFDERSVHKYNRSSYKLTDGGRDNPNEAEGSTTYTLPYWMGRYHNMITPGV